MTEWRNFINESERKADQEDIAANKVILDMCKDIKCTPKDVKKMLGALTAKPILDGVKQLLGMPLGPKPLSPEDLKVINKLLEIDPKQMIRGGIHGRRAPETALSMILNDYPSDVLKSYLSHIEGLFNDPSHRFDTDEQIKRYRNLANELEYQLMSPEGKEAYKRARRAAAGEVVTGGGKTSVQMYKKK